MFGFQVGFPYNFFFYLIGLAVLIGVRFAVGLVSDRTWDKWLILFIYFVTTVPFLLFIDYSSLSFLIIFEVLDVLLLNPLMYLFVLAYGGSLLVYRIYKPRLRARLHQKEKKGVGGTPSQSKAVKILERIYLDGYIAGLEEKKKIEKGGKWND